MFKKKSHKGKKAIKIIENLKESDPVLPNYVEKYTLNGPCKNISEFNKLSFELMNCADYESVHLILDNSNKELGAPNHPKTFTPFQRCLHIVAYFFM